MRTKRTWLGVMAMSALLVGCNTAEEEEKVQAEAPQEEAVQEENVDTHDHDHDHAHANDEAAKQIYAGYFEDDQVKARELSDWAGDWQSVYPYLLDGTLDEVFTAKAEKDNSMSAAEYKDYYTIGYKTNVARIVIDGDQVTFTKDGQSLGGKYVSDGHEILTYEKGNRGVRYIFKLTEPAEDLPQYIQFSDHGIFPTKADHYHIYMGDDRAALLEEVTNWPTYYPSSMDGPTIVQEMLAH